MRSTSVMILILEVYLLPFLILKACLLLTALPELPGSVPVAMFTSAGLYLHLKLLLRQMWAWYLNLIPNLMDLALAVLYLIFGSIRFQWGAVLEKG